MTDQKHAVDKFNNSLAKRYKDNSLPSAFLATMSGIPMIGAFIQGGQVILEHKIDQIYYDRLITLLEELNKSKQEIPDTLLETEPFLHSVFLIYKCSINTYQRKKIRYFARILKSGLWYGELASDRFEEFVRLLDELSVRELYLLRLLSTIEHQYCDENPNDCKDDEKNVGVIIWDTFLEEACNELEVDRDNIIGIMTGLSRSGLFRPIVGMTLGIRDGMGSTTSVYTDFSKWIIEQDD